MSLIEYEFAIEKGLVERYVWTCGMPDQRDRGIHVHASALGARR
jgi:hypothetical protein